MNDFFFLLGVYMDEFIVEIVEKEDGFNGYFLGEIQKCDVDLGVFIVYLWFDYELGQFCFCDSW